MVNEILKTMKTIKTMKTKFLLLTLILFVIGCVSNEKKTAQSNDGAIVIDVNSALKGESLYLDDMVESVQLIPLETTEASILGDATDCIVTDKNIFVTDIYESGQGLTVFDRNGKFVKRFSRGSGPGEFTNLGNVMFYGGNLYCNALFKIMKFSADGEFIDSKGIDGIYMLIEKFGDGFVMTQSERMNADKKFKMIKLDSNLVNVAELSLDPIPFPINGGLSVIEGGDCLIYRFADNDIYACCDDGFKVKYRLDLSEFEYKIPFEKYQDLTPDSPGMAIVACLQEIEDGKYIFDGSCMQCEDYLMFNIMSKNSSKSVYYNKNTGRTWIRDYSRTTTPFSVIGRIRPANVTTQKNTFCGMITPDYLEECWKNNPHNLFSDKDIEILKNIKEDDNPVIVVYKLKDDL